MLRKAVLKAEPEYLPNLNTWPSVAKWD